MIDARRWREQYGFLDHASDRFAVAAELKQVVDDAYAGVEAAFKAGGCRCDGGDLAEELVGCILRHLIESNPGYADVLPQAEGIAVYRRRL